MVAEPLLTETDSNHTLRPLLGRRKSRQQYSHLTGPSGLNSNEDENSSSTSIPMRTNHNQNTHLIRRRCRISEVYERLTTFVTCSSAISSHATLRARCMLLSGQQICTSVVHFVSNPFICIHISMSDEFVGDDDSPAHASASEFVGSADDEEAPGRAVHVGAAYRAPASALLLCILIAGGVGAHWNRRPIPAWAVYSDLAGDVVGAFIGQWNMKTVASAQRLSETHRVSRWIFDEVTHGGRALCSGLVTYEGVREDGADCSTQANRVGSNRHST